MKTFSMILIGAMMGVGLLKAQQPVLTIDGGKIEGVAGDAPQVTVYKGIPYAAPPVGELRWKKPQPVQPWEGIRKCDKWGNICLQEDMETGSFYWKEFYEHSHPTKSEDCLYLNVWTPSSAKADDKLPVMVWIHGGAFDHGYSHEMEFGGDAYAQKGVILVTINYRVGMCGFLAHPLLTAENGGNGSGNYGLFDQLEALQWVHRNIKVFGGDPDNVTLFGQSAGAGSVQTLISTPLSKGLIHRAIIQSGGGLTGIISPKTREEAEQAGLLLWKNSGAETLAEMRACPADKFQAMTQQLEKGIRPYRPCIDGELITATYDETAKAGKTLDIPYMIGYTSEDIAPDVMKKAAVEWSLLQESLGRQPAYVYCFCRDLPGEDIDESMKGAFHTSEVWYSFGTLNRCWRPMTEADYELSRRMVDYWTNFAKTGNPNGESVPQWDPCVKSRPHIQMLDIQ